MKRIVSAFKFAQDAHIMSEELRENDKHIEALQVIEVAIVLYQKEKNYLGFAKALQSRVLIYKHLFLLTSDVAFAILARQDAKSSLEIVQKHNLKDALSSCFFRLGEISMLFENYENASDYYQKSLDVYTGTNTEKGDYRYHLGEALYRNGKKTEGIKTMLEGLKEIQDNRGEVDSFLANVWEAGCYMKLAELVIKDNLGQAKEYFKKAQEIVDSDDKLVIRRRQIADLAKKLN